ncbi:1-deoxy-D-xylulose-5-phosphate synthase, partial [Helicobacter pylori]|nr:1-deoxy-D-xylulose-5-phosphate synthase [Helicobacter pylori]
APYQKLYVFSDNYKLGAVASAMLEFLSEQNILKPVKSFHIIDDFTMLGKTALADTSLGLDTKSETPHS